MIFAASIMHLHRNRCLIGLNVAAGEQFPPDTHNSLGRKRAAVTPHSSKSGFALPAVLVPYPYAADDHQTRNAEVFVRANAALLLPESELSGELLANKIRELLSDPSVLRTMSKQTEALARRNAARMVVETMERYSQPNDAVAA